jgi:hypothetical protein
VTYRRNSGLVQKSGPVDSAAAKVVFNSLLSFP